MIARFNKPGILVPQKRAFIITFSSAHVLYELIVKLNLPNEKTPQVRGNRKYRMFAETEFHACKEMLRMKVDPGMIESIDRLNP